MGLNTAHWWASLPSLLNVHRWSPLEGISPYYDHGDQLFGMQMGGRVYFGGGRSRKLYLAVGLSTILQIATQYNGYSAL